jgi:hypothetical protein
MARSAIKLDFKYISDDFGNNGMVLDEQDRESVNSKARIRKSKVRIQKSKVKVKNRLETFGIFIVKEPLLIQNSDVRNRSKVFGIVIVRKPF